MTQQQLARAVGMPQPSIARIERGTVLPRTATLTALGDPAGDPMQLRAGPSSQMVR
jgi:predicted transcriptional regulator